MKKGKSIEDICIRKIEGGIRSIKLGTRKPKDVDKDLEFCFNKLKELNEGMYTDLLSKFNIEVLKVKDIKKCV